MIEQTLLQFKNIGDKKLKKLLRAGYDSWDKVLCNIDTIPLESNQKKYLVTQIQQWKEKLVQRDLSFLVNNLRGVDKWTVLHDFFTEASYFDIETDGLGHDCRITVIVCLHKGKLHKFVRDENLNDFIHVLENVQLMVSFNGLSFDAPVVNRHFQLKEFPVPHIDLRWICFQKNLRGGLKSIEKQLQIQRPESLQDVGGAQAVLLWNEWENNYNQDARNKLVQYCAADVVALKLVSAKILKMYDKDVDANDAWELWRSIEN